jgi:hypothetical protein
MDAQHDGEQIGLDPQAKGRKVRDPMEHIVEEQRPRQEIASATEGDESREANSKIDQMGRVGIAREKIRYGDGAPAECIPGVFVQLH